MVRPDLVFGPSELGYVAQLCRLVQGLPLGLELAASWTLVLGCQAIAEQVVRSALAPARLAYPSNARGHAPGRPDGWRSVGRAEGGGLEDIPGPMRADGQPQSVCKKP